MVSKALFSSNSDEWETPPDLFDSLNEEFNFSVDMAATMGNRKCAIWIEDIDKVERLWEGAQDQQFWCNPPYSNIKKFLEFRQKHNLNAVFLVPARTDVKWFHEYVYNKAEIRFIKGRLKFSGSKNNAPFPSMIVVFKRTYE